MSTLRRPLFAAVIAIAVAAPYASAQRVTTPSGIPRQNLVSANPIGLLFEWYNGEYERGLNSTTSLAVAASSFGDLDDFDDSRYSVLDGIARYYPAGRALRGFSVGASIGLVNFEDDVEDCFGCEDESGTFATIGIRGDYVWILGRDQRFSIATGLGAKRILGSDGLEGLPIGRLSLGYAW